MTALTDTADGGSRPGGRVQNVDVLRAVAALMVLAGHAYFLGGREVAVKAERWYDVLVITGAAGVWLFFAVSGYVIARPFIDRLVSGEPLPGLAAYARRRIVRVIPLYWVVLTAFLVVTGLGATKGWEVVLQYALLQNLVPGREYALFSVAWTLSIEILFYLAVPVLALTIRARYQRVTAEWLAAAILVSWAASILFATVLGLAFEGKEAVWGRVVFPSTWQMFCPGLLVALAPHLTAPGWRRWLVDFPRRRAAMVVMVVLLAAAAVLSPTVTLRYGVHAFALAIDLLRIPWAIGFGLLLAFAVRARPLRNRALLQMGLVSYGIYLIHPVVMELLERYWIPFPREGLGPYVVHLGVLLGITMAVALVSWKYFEEPLIRWSRRRGGSAPSPEVPAQPSRSAYHA